MGRLIHGVSLQPLRIIRGELGDVLHALKKSDKEFAGFGEAYFSTVKGNQMKGWKCHTKMILNFIVPAGSIRIVVYDPKKESETYNNFNEFVLGPEAEYARLTIEPGLWVAFQGKSDGLNLLLNVASILHDPAEAISLPINNDQIPNFNW
jgi:dTDP-4-dehydrorhamnose 3,5-epimerase